MLSCMNLKVETCLFLSTGDIEEAFLQATGVGLYSGGSWNLQDNQVNVSPDAETHCKGGQDFLGYVDRPEETFDVWDAENQCGRIQTKEEVMAEIAKWEKGKDSTELVTYQWAIAFIVTYTDIFPKVDNYIFEP